MSWKIVSEMGHGGYDDTQVSVSFNIGSSGQIYKTMKRMRYGDPFGGADGYITNNSNYHYLNQLDFETYNYRVRVKELSGSTVVLSPDMVWGRYYYTSEYYPEQIGVTFIIERQLKNATPTLSDSTTNNVTLYENDLFNINGNTVDTDSGDVVTVRYSIDNGTSKAITTAISKGIPISYTKQLKLEDGRLYDDTTAITERLEEGSQHTLKIWAEDNNSGKSKEVIRVFYVVQNRPPQLTIDPFILKENLIDTDKITIKGNVIDLDGNDVTVKYKLNTKAYLEAYSGKGGVFEFKLDVLELKDKNTLTVQAIDSYGAITSRSLEVDKGGIATKLKESVVRYEVIPPNSIAEGMTLWIQREIGDLEISVDISMGTVEEFKPMIKKGVKYISPGIEEDEFSFENLTEESKVLLRITMNREDVKSTEGITLISGVFH